MEHYQPKAAAIIDRAFKEARALGHGSVGVEHLLLAFAHDADSSEAAALRVMGLYYPQLRDHVTAVYGRQAPHELSLPYNTAARHILEIAARNGDASKEDLFDALLAFNNGILDGLIRGIRSSAATSHAKNFRITDLLKDQQFGDDLASAMMSGADFLPFLRNLEEQALEDNLRPFVLFWASDDAAWLLPPDDVRATLVQNFASYHVFSENDKDSPRQWCFFMFSEQICLVLSAQQALRAANVAPGQEEYWCVGSIDASVGRAVLNRLKDRIGEVAREAILEHDGFEKYATNPGNRETIRAAWRVCIFPDAGKLLDSGEPIPRPLHALKAETDTYDQTEHSHRRPRPVLVASPDANYNRRNRYEGKAPPDVNEQIPFAQGDFTEAANFALLFARFEAVTTNLTARKIDQRALLAGIVMEHSGTAGKLARLCGLSLKALRKLHEGDSFKSIDMAGLDSVDYDKDVRRILAMARKNARTAGESKVQTIHLLWSLVNAGHGTARDAFSKQVTDIVAFKQEIDSHLSCYRHEGYSKELELNVTLINTLVRDADLYLSVDDIAPDETGDELIISPGKISRLTSLIELKNIGDIANAGNFDLTALDDYAAAMLEDSLFKFQQLSSPVFQARHLLLGIISDKYCHAARYMRSNGVTTELVTMRLTDMEEHMRLGEKPRGRARLSVDVSHTLLRAQKFAWQAGQKKVSIDYIFWALADSNSGIDRRLYKNLGLNPFYLLQDAPGLCFPDLTEVGRYSPQFATITKSGLHIYAMLCEAATGDAMQAALKEAACRGLATVCGDLLLYCLLQQSQALSARLNSNGITLDAIKIYLDNRYGNAISATVKDAAEREDFSSTGFDSRLEMAFNHGLAFSLKNKRVLVGPQDVIHGLTLSADEPLLAMCEALKITPEKHLRQAARGADVDPESVSFNQSADDNTYLNNLLKYFKCLPSADVVDLLQKAIKKERDSGGGRLGVRAFIDSLASDRFPFAYWLKAFSSQITVEPQDAVVFALAQSGYFAQALGEVQVQRQHILLALLEYFLAKKCLSPGAVVDRLQILAYSDAKSLRPDDEFMLAPAAMDCFYSLDPLAKSIFVRAGRCAGNLGHNFFGPEHLLHAFLAFEHADFKTFLSTVFGDDAAAPYSRSLESLLVKYGGSLMQPFYGEVSISSTLANRIRDLSKSSNLPDSSRITAAGLLHNMLCGDIGLIPILLRDLNIEPLFIESNLQKLVRADKFSHLFKYKGPPRWEVSPPTPAKNLDISVFASDAATCLAVVVSSGDVQGDVLPSDLLKVLLKHPSLAFMSSNKQNSQRFGINPNPAVNQVAHELAESTKDILLNAHSIMQNRYLGNQIELEHILLAILESLDCETGAFDRLLEEYGLNSTRAQLLVLGYIHRKSQGNL